MEPFEAVLHISFRLEEAGGGPPGGPPGASSYRRMSAAADSWKQLSDSLETEVGQTQVVEGVGLVLLHRSACVCMQEQQEHEQEDEEEAEGDAAMPWAGGMGPPPPPTAQGGALGGTLSRGGWPGGAAKQSIVPTGAEAAGSSRGGSAASATDVYFSTGGLVGLVNLANTCFLNAAVQCLSVVLPFSRYFLSGAYRRDINMNNCMGTQGRLADAYAKTLRVSNNINNK